MFSLPTLASCLRRGLLKLWSASATTRSPADSDSGRTSRTAGGSTTPKWPEKLPSSPGQTERIPGSADSESDGMGRYQWTGWDGASKVEEAIKINTVSLSHLLEEILRKAAFMLLRCLTVEEEKKMFVDKHSLSSQLWTLFPFSPHNLAWKEQCLYL